MGLRENFYGNIMAIQPEVSGSCYYCTIKYPDGTTKQFIVDCGLFQEKDYIKYNETLPFIPENIEFVLVTHNHIDHTGRLPFLVKKGYNNPIYATQATCDFLPYALEDSFKVLKDVSKHKNEKCLYSEADVEKTLNLLCPCEYEKKVRIDNSIRVTFFKNGHLIGAAIILVQISYPGYDDINILFTGDYNNKNMFFDVPKIPKWVTTMNLTLIQESTYGTTNSFEVEGNYKEKILQTIELGGTVITPVFSLGRSQEILYELKNMQETGMLSKEVPIYLDGKLAIKYTNLYLHNDSLEIKEEMKKFLPENLTFVSKDIRGKLLEDSNVKIILTTSGMGCYGPAQTYIPQYLPIENSLIHFTGFTAEGTLGERLKSTEHGNIVNVAGLVVVKKANVEYTAEYSAHAKADEMIEFLKQFTNLKLVLVTHGEFDVKQKFAERILREVEPKNVGILGRDYFFRINPYGLVKTIGTKFN